MNGTKNPQSQSRVEQFGQAASNAADQIGEAVSGIPQAIRDKPYQAIAAGFGAGILIGVALQRRFA